MILSAIALLAAVTASSPHTVVCSDFLEPSNEFETATESALRFVPISRHEFSRTFDGVKPQSLDGLRFYATLVDKAKDDDDPTATLRVAVAVDSKHTYRLADENGEWPDVMRSRHDPAPQPHISRVSAGLFRLDDQEVTYGAHATVTTDSTLLIAAGRPPRVVGGVDCTVIEMGGACTAPASLFGQPGTALICNWSESEHDFLCRAAREWTDLLWSTHRAERRFWLMKSKELSVRVGDLQSLPTMEELARSAATAEIGRRVLVQGVGVLQHVSAGEIGYPKTSFFVAPGLTDDMDLRLWAVSGTGHLVAAKSEKLLDGYEKESLKDTGKDERDLYTQVGVDWSARFIDRSGPGALLLLNDGRGRGLFWVAFDETTDPPAVGVLRLATDTMAWDECVRFIAPAGASRITATADGLDVLIEPHTPRDEAGNLSDSNDEDQPPCHVHALVRWSRDKGFVQTDEDVPCKPGEWRLSVVIDAHGAISTHLIPR